MLLSFYTGPAALFMPNSAGQGTSPLKPVLDNQHKLVFTLLNKDKDKDKDLFTGPQEFV